MLPRFRFLPDSDPNFLGRAGTFLVGCQCQALRGTFWRFGTPIGRAGPSEAGLLFCRAETGVSLEPLRRSHVPGAGGWSIPAASAWATPADSDSASEAFASAFPSCPRPVRLPPRAPRPRLVPSPAELGSWGEGPRLLQGFRFRPFPTRFPIPRHPEPRPNPGGTGQPARGPGFPQLPLNPPTARAQLSREPTWRQFNPWSLNDPASPDPTLRPFTKKTLPLRNWEPVPPLNVGCSYYQRPLHTRPPGVHSEVPHLGHQAQPNCFVCPRGPPLCSRAQSGPECCLPGWRQAHGQCVSSGAPLEDEDV